MKLTALSTLLLKPFNWIRKIRGFKLVYTPLLAIVLFTAVMGIILGTLHLQEKGQQEAALFRELSFAKQRIQLRIANNTDALNTINREITASTEDPKLRQLVRDQAEDLIINNHEIIKLIWMNSEGMPIWSAPISNVKSDWNQKYQNDRLVKEGLASVTYEFHTSLNRAVFAVFEVDNDCVHS